MSNKKKPFTKKLYLVSYYFAPLGRADGVNRTYLVKYLSELNWDIDVVSCKNPHGFIRSFQKDPTLLDIIPVDVKHHQIKSTYWGPLGGIAEILKMTDDSFANWIRPTVNALDSIIEEDGIVYAVVPPITNAKIAYQIAQEKDLPLVIDFRDDVFNLEPHMVQQADRIFASTKDSLHNMLKHYNLPSDSGIVIYNGYPISQHSTIIKTLAPNEEPLNIVFAGLLSLVHDPAMLAKAVRHMETKHPETKNKVVVDYYGPENFYTKLFLRRYLTENIHFHGYVPYKTVLKKIAQADLAYVSIKTQGRAYSIPSKIFQYIAMETPTLAVGPGGALKTFMKDYKIGRYAQTDDINAQAEDIYFYLNNQQAYNQTVENIRKIKSQFAMQTQAKKLSNYMISTLLRNE